MKKNNRVGGKPYEKRNIEIVELYKTSNFSLEKIGKEYDVSRERIRQILEIKIGAEQIREIMKQRFLNKIIKEYGSLENYTELKEQERKNRLIKLGRKGKWNLKYDCCIECGGTKRPHSSRGRCATCAMRFLYHNSPGRKETQIAHSKIYYIKNKEKVNAKQRIYNKKYFSKPENKKRFKEAQKIYRQRPEVKLRLLEYAREYYKRPEAIAKRKEYEKTEKCKLCKKEYAREYNQRPGVKARKKERDRLNYLKKKDIKQNQAIASFD